ncbi:hypothetical protein [Streptomyces sp. MMG1533]|uniref:hypothetical protein n=1 Tax=Streptomyces sp. MMG1533 TaxID=1415546 RepID=UPI001F1D5911|nr:hypothetical protein [Streptomyces sp. MMG1533]
MGPGEAEEGAGLLENALRRGRPGPYQSQVAVAACHTTAPTAAETDWADIAGLYGELQRFVPSAVVRLDRAVAVGMAEGPRRASRWWRNWKARANRPATTCCPPPAPTCCAAPGARGRRPRRTSERWSSWRAKRSGGSWHGGSRSVDPRSGRSSVE